MVKTGNPDVLAQRIMPHYFKHCNYQSFVRQLNNYGFHKMDSRQGEVFSNRFFVKDRPDLLCQIKRRVHPSISKQAKAAKLDTSSASSGDESTEPSNQSDSNSQPQQATLAGTLSLSSMTMPLPLTASLTGGNPAAMTFQQKLPSNMISSTMPSSAISGNKRESPEVAALTQRVAVLETQVSELQHALNAVCSTLQSITGKSVLIPSPRSTLAFQHPILPPLQPHPSPHSTASSSSPQQPSTPLQPATSASKPGSSTDQTPACFKVPALGGLSSVVLPPLSPQNK